MSIGRNYKKIIILVIATAVFLGGYSVWKNYSEQSGIEEGGRVDVVPDKIIKWEDDDAEKLPVDQDGEPTSDDRDNQRVGDLKEIGIAIDEYAKLNNGEYPSTNGFEKISDENSYIFMFLSQNGYLKKNYKDPLSGSYFYGYSSDGKKYELTAALEDLKDSRCEIIGTLCIYRIKKP